MIETSYSIGCLRDDGDFAILATLNNLDAHLSAEKFEELAAYITTFLEENIESADKVIRLERQDVPDYVQLDEEELAAIAENA